MVKNYTSLFEERIDYMTWGRFDVVWLTPGMQLHSRVAAPADCKSATSASLWAQRNAPSDREVVGYRLTRPNA